jgi:(p)ppGpp synthase/HD superfamily hydrolase
LIRSAAEFARAAHERIGQRRKYTGEPYIVHPQAVAATVATVTDDEVVIAAAWLHDVVEDTPVTIDQIEAEFGAEVARLVADLTDAATKADGNRRQRKAIDREHTAGADPRAKTVKLADLIDNLSDIVNQAPDFASTYLEEKELLMEVLSEGHPALYRRVEQILRDAKALLAQRG